MTEHAAPNFSLQRAWWIRTLLVLQAPSAVFAALRSTDEEDLDARTEPLVAVGMLAGIAAVISTSVAGRYLDDPGGGLLVVAAWAVFAGALYGLGALWLGGLLVHLAARRLRSRGTYRRARHLVGFALVPVALTLPLLWPIRLALYGSDVFRAGGMDAGAEGAHVLDVLYAAAGVWTLVLLLIGIRAVHRWTWVRSFAALAIAAALPLVIVAWCFWI